MIHNVVVKQPGTPMIEDIIDAHRDNIIHDGLAWTGNPRDIISN